MLSSGKLASKGGIPTSPFPPADEAGTLKLAKPHQGPEGSSAPERGDEVSRQQDEGKVQVEKPQPGPTRGPAGPAGGREKDQTPVVSVQSGDNPVGQTPTDTQTLGRGPEARPSPSAANAWKDNKKKWQAPPKSEWEPNCLNCGADNHRSRFCRKPARAPEDPVVVPFEVKPSEGTRQNKDAKLIDDSLKETEIKAKAQADAEREKRAEQKLEAAAQKIASEEALMVVRMFMCDEHESNIAGMSAKAGLTVTEAFTMLGFDRLRSLRQMKERFQDRNEDLGDIVRDAEELVAALENHLHNGGDNRTLEYVEYVPVEASFSIPHFYVFLRSLAFIVFQGLYYTQFLTRFSYWVSAPLAFGGERTGIFQGVLYFPVFLFSVFLLVRPVTVAFKCRDAFRRFARSPDRSLVLFAHFMYESGLAFFIPPTTAYVALLTGNSFYGIDVSVLYEMVKSLDFHVAVCLFYYIGWWSWHWFGSRVDRHLSLIWLSSSTLLFSQQVKVVHSFVLSMKITELGVDGAIQADMRLDVEHVANREEMVRSYFRSDNRNISFRAAKGLARANPALVRHKIRFHLKGDLARVNAALSDYSRIEKAVLGGIRVRGATPKIQNRAWTTAMRQLLVSIDTEAERKWVFCFPMAKHAQDISPYKARRIFQSTVPNIDGCLVDLTYISWMLTHPRFMNFHYGFEDTDRFLRESFNTNGSIMGNFDLPRASAIFQASRVFCLVNYLKRKAQFSGVKNQHQDWGF